MVEAGNRPVFTMTDCRCECGLPCECGDQPTCSFGGCTMPLYARGLCLGHYTQDLRGRPLKPLRGKPSAGRVTVRLSASTLKALGDEPTKRAQEVLEAWAQSRPRR